MTTTKINEKIIGEMETFVRKELFDLLESLCMQQDEEFGDVTKTNFFGTHYTNPADFQFTDEEKRLMLSLAQRAGDNSSANEITTVLEQLSIEDNPNKAGISRWYFEEIVREASHTPSQDLYDDEANTHTHAILKKLLENANRNRHRPAAGYRYDREVKDWAAFIRMLAGPLGYLAIQENLCLALPSLSTINHFIQNTKVIKEGVLRPDELALYLTQRNLPLTVCISEDATRIQGRVQYDSRSNEIVGFVLPINSENGLPKPSMIKARNTEEIVSHFTRKIPTASFVNTIMAQPIGKVPPFCLLIFGTDCRFTTANVSDRWEYVVSELKKVNIEVLTVSSDSDPKFNCAMRKNALLGHSSNIFNADWFRCGNSPEPPFYVQDTTHIGTKLRNFLLKTLKNPAMLPFGDTYHVRLDHLQTLINRISKDKHQLTQTVLDVNDRQNFESVLRICDRRVTDLLKKHVSDSVATVKVLEITRNIIASFMDPELTPLERVFKMWYSVFLIRLWRNYVITKKSLTLKKNFLTSYCYICIELNAHSLILILLYLRKVNKPHLFMPLVYSSQPCESFYRQIRSFTSTYSTVANCTVKEILERINKIQLQNDISSDENSKFKFPKKLKSCDLQSPNTFEFSLPTHSEILRKIREAKKMAINDAITIGLLRDKDSDISLTCELLPYAPQADSSRETEYNRPNQIELLSILSQLKSVSLKNYAEVFDNKTMDETSSYTEVFGGSKRMIIKKTSLCWYLRKNENKLSSDRLKRVQASIKQSGTRKYRKIKIKKRKILFRNLLQKI